MVSIVIPAHNEETVIGRCLRALTDGMRPGEFQIIVVCNGCTDGTAEAAHAFGPPVEVVETEAANKGRALNLGDSRAVHFPRFYVDADVELDAESVRRVAEVLRDGPVRAASPAIRLELAGCSWAVRAFYGVWQWLPYCREGMIGSGVYALSEAGRYAFESFPELIADDEFVRLRFPEPQRRTVEAAQFVSRPPARLRALVRMRARQLRGNREILAHYPELAAREGRSYRRSLAGLFRRPGLWPALVLYTVVGALTHALAWWQLRRGRSAEHWAHDTSSRRPSAT